MYPWVWKLFDDSCDDVVHVVCQRKSMFILYICTNVNSTMQFDVAMFFVDHDLVYSLFACHEPVNYIHSLKPTVCPK